MLLSQKTGVAPQLPNFAGGWTYLASGINMPSNVGTPSIIPTAYAVLLLQDILNLGLSSVNCTNNGTTTNYPLSTAISSGVSFLASKQNANFGFGDSTTTSAPLETALAYLAISAASPSHSSLATAVDYLISKQLVNGSWGNDPQQTGYVLSTFPMTTLVANGTDGMPDDVKAVFYGANPGTLTKGVLSGNGRAITGVNAPFLLPSASLGVPYAYTLTGSGGMAPYTISIAAGNLPSGLALAGGGAISGTPTTVGSFNFTYQTTDSLGKKAVSIAQIEVLQGTPGTIPLEWNLLPGWNLVGYGGTSGSLNVAASFGDPVKVISVWKWIASDATWAFYTPLEADGGVVFAESRGYFTLSTINSGDGFWVNASASFSLQSDVLALLSSTAFQSGAAHGLVPGWNMIATGDSQTPSEFNTTVGGVTSLWAWDSNQQAYYFYSPYFTASQLISYNASRGYLDFGPKKLTPTTGIWINKPW